MSYLSVFEIPMQGARCFFGVEGIHEKLDQHKTMPSNHVFDVDHVIFLVGIQVFKRILRLKSSISIAEVLVPKHATKLFGFWVPSGRSCQGSESRYIGT